MISTSQLATVEKEIALASCEKKVKDYTVNELTYLINGLIHRTHAECGQKEDADNIDLTIDLFVKDLQLHRKNISFQEIELSFRNGYKGEYGEYFGLNNKTYSGWVKGFVMSSERAKAIKQRDEMIHNKLNPETTISKEEGQRIIREGALRCFKEFKDKGEVYDIANVTYRYLDSIGIFQWAEGRKFDFLRKAQEVLKMESQDMLQACKDKIQMQAIRRQLEEINNSQSTQVKSTAMRLALNTFFKDLVEMGIELETKLQEHEYI